MLVDYQNTLHEFELEVNDLELDLSDYVYVIRGDKIMVDQEIYYPIIDYYFNKDQLFFNDYEEMSIKKMKNELIKYLKKL
ncbi:hypothetical protein [Mycoplasma sp. P36-A1]|uniref:hypothetical protein n=1 Tax=Mycoplasma sp. P36-A1 TaxID=3252900 RepID=UPI003C2D5F70